MPIPSILKRPQLAVHTLVLLMGVYITAFLNLRFFRNLASVYPAADGNAAFLASVALVLFWVIVFLLALVSYRATIKPLLAILLPVMAALAYFMDTYSVVIDDVMLRNALETNVREALDLLNLRALAYVLLLGIVPAALVGLVTLHTLPRRRAVLARIGLLLAPLVAIALLVMPFTSQYASFIREHKILREYANPAYPVYALVELLSKGAGSSSAAVAKIGVDARIPAWDVDRELVVLVVGETARFDRFSINGYERNTNPLLSQFEVFSFTDFWSCGTSTSISVPCMFSLHARDFDVDAEHSFENALDVLEHAGVTVLWRDNNSDSKGVATRVGYEDFSTPERNPSCDTECRDIGMLAGLQALVDKQPQGDILIVLHQMGNHGPAYFKRYPPEFEYFTPACHSRELDTCTAEEIDNAYDNAIRYTDFFLAKVIEFLESNDAHFETAMMYVSDHGESLGEYGMYLHGMPYRLAPAVQKHVPAIFWFGRRYHDVDREALSRRLDDHYSHANVFHTLLGLMEIDSETYRPEMDMLPHDLPAESEEPGEERQDQ